MNPNAENGSLFNESSGGVPIPVYLANFVEIAFNAVIGFDSKERITFWNPAAEQLYGWKASEVLGKASAELFEPVSTPEPQENQRQRLIDLERGATVRGEYSPRRKDGSLISIEYTARAILAEDGGLSGYVAVHRDISARKQADEKISRLNAELQTQLDENNSLMEILPIGIWTGNHDCSVITGNPAAYRTMGITPGINVSLSNPEPEMPLGLRIFVDGVEVAPEDAPMQTVARTGKPMYNFEHEFLFANQTRKTFYASIAPVFDQQGIVRKVIAAYADFTERKIAEQVLRESEEQLQLLNETLEQKVNEQTAEVRQLASDLTKAEQRERHRIAHILHEDLQQRIYAIQMQVEFLADGLKRENAALQKDFFKIRKQLSEVMALTRYLSVDLSPPILRDEGLTQAIEWLASQIQEQHGLQIELQAEDSFAIPDEDTQMLLFSCVRELLFNVVKHAGVNEAMVSLRQVNDDFRIEVRDQGKGFDVAALAWHANNNGDEDELQYRSFGLPTLRHRLSLFGGQMDIQSEKDAGTLVTITIPVSK